VRGYTKLHPAVAEHQRGTFAGLTQREIVEYIKSLGVTSVELLRACIRRRQPAAREGLRNYWGYNSIGYFAPDPRYASDRAQSLPSSKEMVARLHDAGLEVILDVVYNHTAEGNERGPTLSFKGIDNSVLLSLLPIRSATTSTTTGTGNTLNLVAPAASFKWSRTLAILGLETHRATGSASILGPFSRASRMASNNQSGFLKVCAQDPVLRRVKLIAEPGIWARGLSVVDSRGFANGTTSFATPCVTSGAHKRPGQPGAAALCVRRHLQSSWPQAWASVNFITAHDGFTLNDSSRITKSTTMPTAKTIRTDTLTIVPGIAV
jgi:glycogen operon protein